MPWYFDGVEEPQQPDSWDEIEEIWQIMKNDLGSLHFESKDEAVAETNRAKDDKAGHRYDDWRLVRFRKSDDHEMLDWFAELGGQAVERVDALIQKRAFTAEFAYHWGMLSACHGYALCAAMAESSDLTHEFLGEASRKVNSRDPQRRWFAHYYHREELHGQPREQRTDRIQQLVTAIIEQASPEYADLDIEWFKRFLNLGETEEENPYYGQITGAFRDRKLTQKAIEALLKEPTDGLPPLDLKFPTP